MAGVPELDAKIASITTSTNLFIADISSLMSEMNSAFSRFLAKLAAGGNSVELQSQIDLLNAVMQKMDATQVLVQNAIAQAKVEGN